MILGCHYYQDIINKIIIYINHINREYKQILQDIHIWDLGVGFLIFFGIIMIGVIVIINIILPHY